MTEFVLPMLTEAKSGRDVRIGYRASVDFAEVDALPCVLLSPKGGQPGRIVGLRLVWYWSALEQSTREPHWEFDRFNSRALVQRRTASASTPALAWGSMLTRTLDTIDDVLATIEPVVVLYAPSDEPVLTWMHRDR